MDILNLVLTLVLLVVLSVIFFKVVKDYVTNFMNYRRKSDLYGMWQELMQGLFTVVLYVFMVLVAIGQLNV